MTDNLRPQLTEGISPKPPQKLRGKILLYGGLGLFLLLGLAAILPCMVPARSTAQRNACICNLRQIDGAKEQYSLEKKIPAGATVSEQDLTQYIKGGWPKCPGGGSYLIHSIGQAPTCTRSDHKI